MHDIWRLQHFIGVAEAGTFHGAARKLNVSQPALTKSIRMLERSFATELFHRLPRGVRLTEAGELLLAHARDIEGAWNAAIVEVGAQATGLGGYLKIGGGPVFSAIFFPHMLAEMRGAYPNLKVTVSTDVGAGLLPKLKTGELRIYAGGLPDAAQNLGPEFRAKHLYKQSNALFASEDHPVFAAADLGDPATTLNYPMLSLFSGQEANNRIAAYFERFDLPEPHLALEAHSIQIALKMVTEHNFIACMPLPLAAAFPEARLREIPLPGFRWSIATGVTYHQASLRFGPIALMIKSLEALTRPFTLQPEEAPFKQDPR